MSRDNDNDDNDSEDAALRNWIVFMENCDSGPNGEQWLPQRAPQREHLPSFMDGNNVSNSVNDHWSTMEVQDRCPTEYTPVTIYIDATNRENVTWPRQMVYLNDGNQPVLLDPTSLPVMQAPHGLPQTLQPEATCDSAILANSSVLDAHHLSISSDSERHDQMNYSSICTLSSMSTAQAQYPERPAVAHHPWLPFQPGAVTQAQYPERPAVAHHPWLPFQPGAVTSESHAQNIPSICPVVTEASYPTVSLNEGANNATLSAVETSSLSVSKVQKVASASAEKSRPKRCKPLTGYNYFYRDERDNIVKHMKEAGDPLPPPINDFSTRKMEELLHYHWHVDPTKNKRQHVKVHGKIKFPELSKAIADRWRLLPESGRQFYRAIAKADQHEYDRYLEELYPSDPSVPAAAARKEQSPQD